MWLAPLASSLYIKIMCVLRIFKANNAMLKLVGNTAQVEIFYYLVDEKVLECIVLLSICAVAMENYTDKNI